MWKNFPVSLFVYLFHILLSLDVIYWQNIIMPCLFEGRRLWGRGVYLNVHNQRYGSYYIEYPPPLPLAKGGLKMEGLNSQMGSGKVNSQRGLDSRGLPCFCANVSFLWQHCYKLFISLCISNMFDIAESLTQNIHGPI